MRKTSRPLPKTLEAARAELAKIERRMRADKQRMEQIEAAIGGLHSQHKIPAVGSRWLRTSDLGYRGKTSTTEYEFVSMAYPEVGSPVLVFLGRFDLGGKQSAQHSAVSFATFYREFDPAPASKAKRKRQAS